jgi:polygalacturonase
MSDLLITDCGAVPDGVTLNTRAINQAIDQQADLGGGRVVIPNGTFLSGTVRLKSNITLHLEEGAVLLGSPDLKDYAKGNWGHHNDITPWHLILAEDCHNIGITGPGTIRGNGFAFWEPERPNAWTFYKHKNNQRVSPMVELVRCERVLVERIRLEDSAGWTLHCHDCDHLRIEGISIQNTLFGPNTDGIDLTGCRDAIIHGCQIETGDDAIALKTSEYSRACEQVVISDCILRTSCVGIRIGYESRQDFRNIVITNILIPRCSRVFDLRAIEGATIEGVRISNVVASTDSGWPANRAIEIIALDRPSIFKNLLPLDHQDYGKDRPLTRSSRIRDVSFTGIDITTDGRITIIGKPDGPVEGVRFSDLRLRFPLLDDPLPFAGNDKSAGFIPGAYATARGARAVIVAQHARNISFEGLRVNWPEYPVGPWKLFESENRNISSFWKSHEQEIRLGKHRVSFGVVWARDAQLNIRDARFQASEPDCAAVQADKLSHVNWHE